MDKQALEALARRAGLDKALAEHRADVEAAFALSATHRAVVRAPENPAVEPWPPMRAGDAR